MSDGPVGVLGDGWAALALADAVQARLPHEDVLVLADSAYAPWAERDPRRVRLRVDEIARDLVARGAKALVLASPVGASDAADVLTTAAGVVPVLVLESGVREASRLAGGRPVAVVTAAGTTRPRPHGQALRRARTPTPPGAVTWPGARELVEAGRAGGPEAARLVEAGAAALVAARVDAVALGDPATARLRPLVEAALAGSGIAVADCATATAGQLWLLLRQRGLVAHRRRPGRRQLVSSDPVRGAAGLAGGPPWRGGAGRG